MFPLRHFTSPLIPLLVCTLLLLELSLIATSVMSREIAARQRQTVVTLELKPDAPVNVSQELFASLRVMPAVAHAEYITAEERLSNASATLPVLLAAGTAKAKSAFTDTIAITLASLSQTESLVRFLNAPRWSGVVNATTLPAILGRVSVARDGASMLKMGMVLAMAMALLAGFGVFATAALHVRMRLASDRSSFLAWLSGASPLQHLLPFVREWVLLIAIATVASVLLFIACMRQAVFLWNLLMPHFPLGPLMLGFFLCALLAFAGSWLAIRSLRRWPAFGNA